MQLQQAQSTHRKLIEKAESYISSSQQYGMPQSNKFHLNSNRSNEISIEDGNVNYVKEKKADGNPSGKEPNSHHKLISLHSPASLSSSDSLHSVLSSPKHPQRTEAQ